jgi:hypothetical protein
VVASRYFLLLCAFFQWAIPDLRWAVWWEGQTLAEPSFSLSCVCIYRAHYRPVGFWELVAQFYSERFIMQVVTAMKVPDKYEPKNADEFGTFDRAMDKILAVPGTTIQKKIKRKKARKKRAKASESGPSRDSA